MQQKKQKTHAHTQHTTKNLENAGWAWSDFDLWSSRPAQNDLPQNPNKNPGLSAQKKTKIKGKRKLSDSRDPWPLASGLASAGRAKRKQFFDTWPPAVCTATHGKTTKTVDNDSFVALFVFRESSPKDPG